MPAAQRTCVFLLDWALTEGPPPCVWETLGLHLWPLPTLPGNLWSHVPTLEFVSSQVSPQSQLVYTAPSFLSVSYDTLVNLLARLPTSTPTLHPDTSHPVSTQWTEGSP